MPKRTKQEPQVPEPGPVSQELLALWARVLEAPFRYRLTDLQTQTTWALTLRDGRLVPEVEVVCGPPDSSQAVTSSQKHFATPFTFCAQ